jgi:hypothetical protein
VKGGNAFGSNFGGVNERFAWIAESERIAFD